MDSTDFQNLHEQSQNYQKYKESYLWQFSPKYLRNNDDITLQYSEIDIPIEYKLDNEIPENTPFETFILGLFTGVFHAVVGHPLDTIKTRLQTHCSRTGLFRNLLSGIAPPLLTVPFSWSIYWSIYSTTTNIFDNHHFRYLTIFGCGAISGGIPCLILCPTDLIKCYSQKYHLKSVDATKSIYHKFIYQNADVIITSQPQIRTSMRTLLTKGIIFYFIIIFAFIDNIGKNKKKFL